MNEKEHFQKLDLPDDYWEPLWPGKPIINEHKTPGVETAESWVNKKCQVLVYDYIYPAKSYEKDWPKVVELSLKLNTREPWQDWRDFYRIKSELCGTACWAMEMYPPQTELLDTANQYHMYVLEPGIQWPIFNQQLPITDYSEDWEKVLEEGKKRYGEAEFARMSKNSKQREWYDHHKCDDLPLIGPVWAKRGWFLDSEGRIHSPEGNYGIGLQSSKKG